MRDHPATTMTAAIAMTLVWGCAVAPSPSSSPAPSEPPFVPSPTPVASVALGAIPPLLVFTPSGPDQGLWRIDPNAPAPLVWAARVRVGTPRGVWEPTAPSTAGRVALTSVNEMPVRVALAQAAGDVLTPLWVRTLPDDAERWSDGKAECVSPDGTVAVGDGGEVLYTLDSRGGLALVPGQRNNLGECAWLDPTTLMWDQEEAEMRSWTVGAADSVPVPIRRFGPSAAGDRLAWFDDATETIRVARFQLAGNEVRVESETLGVAVPPDDHPASPDLSVDGRWLLTLFGRALAIYPVSETGLGELRRIPLAEAGLPGEFEITWMPTP